MHIIKQQLSECESGGGRKFSEGVGYENEYSRRSNYKQLDNQQVPLERFFEDA